MQPILVPAVSGRRQKMIKNFVRLPLGSIMENSALISKATTLKQRPCTCMFEDLFFSIEQIPPTAKPFKWTSSFFWWYLEQYISLLTPQKSYPFCLLAYANCRSRLLIFFLSIDSLLLGIPITKPSFAIVTRSLAETLSSSLISSGSSIEGKKPLTGRCLLMKSESDLEQIMLFVMILISYKCDIIDWLILCDQTLTRPLISFKI